MRAPRRECGLNMASLPAGTRTYEKLMRDDAHEKPKPPQFPQLGALPNRVVILAANHLQDSYSTAAKQLQIDSQSPAHHLGQRTA